ncbi:hypothetical protein [Nostoc sp. C057]|uniref:hypothetical protein n=1 Tax=Nostoc sp. C057 TaxID=2576903 RepID=UPI0015C405DF|nr:hypothetical protein [Nostoc sp. C057]
MISYYDIVKNIEAIAYPYFAISDVYDGRSWGIVHLQNFPKCDRLTENLKN